MSQPIRILLVDDSPHSIVAIRDFLDFQDRLEVVGTATNRREAVGQSIQLQPDIILLDMNLAGTSGLSLIPFLRMNVPKSRIIVLTIMEDAVLRTAALESGADDFVSKKSMSQTLIPAIREQIARGGNGHAPGDHTST
jgi:two-component system nitrate/nitrite response regulator NarL